MAITTESDNNNSQQNALNETTPLLADNNTTPDNDSNQPPPLVRNHLEDDKPLPKAQILFLCYARLVEPLTYFAIFPFISQMVQQNGNLQEAEIGFYSGLIESLFSLTQMCVMVFWGRVSDRVGRKPVLIGSLIGVTITTSAFGFTTTIWQMILFRCMAGVFAGTVVTIRTMITELSTPTTQARAFSFFMFSSSFGVFLGPLIGGLLADPVNQYGGFFKKIPLFVHFPYALPTLATGVFGVTAVLVVTFFVDETLPVRKPASEENANGKSKDGMLTTWQLVKQPGVALVLYLYAHLMILAYAYTAITPVIWYTSIELGGFSFTSLQISMVLAGSGISQALWFLLAFPPLQQRFGTGWVLRVCSIAYLFFFAFPPLLNLLLRHAEAHNIEWEKKLFWVIGPTLICLGVGVAISFAAIQLAINDISPSPATLGTLNGLALSVASATRAFIPALASSILAVGVKHQILGGQLIWAVLFVFAIGFVVLARNLPAKAEGLTKKVPVLTEDAGTDRDEIR